MGLGIQYSTFCLLVVYLISAISSFVKANLTRKQASALLLMVFAIFQVQVVQADISEFTNNDKFSDTQYSQISEAPPPVEFQIETLFRPTGSEWGGGDNWCITWAADNTQITSMDDGDWLNEAVGFHNMLYRITGDAVGFTRSRPSAYPRFYSGDPGWFGYGVVAVDNTIYSMVSKTPGPDWSGPFLGVKMLKSTDNGSSWYRVNKQGDLLFLATNDSLGRNSTATSDMFFMEEFGQTAHGQIAYPFSWVSFVQNGQAATDSPDGYIYVYAPESSQSNHLLLARAKKGEFEVRDNWEYFKQWSGTTPVWTSDINQRGAVHIFPEKNSNDEYFGWYSWLPSVVWNPGLGVYIMVNGGTYAGSNMTPSNADYYSAWMHTKTGSLGFWYATNPWGPWQEFYYTEYFTVDDPGNLIYQPKLSPKWISGDGREMVLIWSDAMRNAQGQSHTVNYRWNQMTVKLNINPVIPPEIITPVSDSTFSSSTQVFNWDYHGNQVEQWALYVGSTVGGSEYQQQGMIDNATTATVVGLPTDGSTIYIRLWYRVGSEWSHVDETYKAATLAPINFPEIANPVSNNILSGSTQVFT